MTSPNLAVPHVAAAQNQKEVTINDATDALDNAMNRALAVDMADADRTLSAAEAHRHGLITLDGTLTAPRSLTLPAQHRRLAIRNATLGGHAVDAGYPGTGARVTVPPASAVLVQGDGVDLHGIDGGGGAGGALADLSDVAVTGAASGDTLRFDGAAWQAAGSGIFRRALLPFRGALLRRTTTFGVTTTGAYVAVPWQSADDDTDAFWDPGQPARLTVPAGVTRVRLAANIEWQTSPTSQLVELRRNGSSVAGGGAVIMRGDGGFSNQMRNISSAVLAVTAGDWFELMVYLGTSGEVRGLDRTWLAIEVVETSDAAEPPADISGFSPDAPAAGAVIWQAPAARRTLLKTDLAGSRASAAIAASAAAVFELRRNGTVLGTMTFAAGAATATFAAAGESTLEPGDMLAIVAPASPDPTLAGIGFTLAGTLVV